MIATIDGRQIKDEEDFHHIIKQVLDFPDFYGENLDALWDCLTGFIEVPTTVIWMNFKLSRENLGQRAEQIVEVFKDAEPYKVYLKLID